MLGPQALRVRVVASRMRETLPAAGPAQITARSILDQPSRSSDERPLRL